MKLNVARDFFPIGEIKIHAYQRHVRRKVSEGIRSAELGKTWSLAAACEHLKMRIGGRASR